MSESFVVKYVDDFDNVTTAEVPGAAGQNIPIPQHWIAVSFNTYTNGVADSSQPTTLYFSSINNAAGAVTDGQIPQ